MNVTKTLFVSRTGIRVKKSIALEVGVAGGPRERDYIADIGHPGEIHDEALEPQTEPGMRYGPISAQV